MFELLLVLGQYYGEARKKVRGSVRGVMFFFSVMVLLLSFRFRFHLAFLSLSSSPFFRFWFPFNFLILSYLFLHSFQWDKAASWLLLVRASVHSFSFVLSLLSGLERAEVTGVVVTARKELGEWGCRTSAIDT